MKTKKIMKALFCCFLWGIAFPSMSLLYDGFEIMEGDTGEQILLAGIRFSLAGFLLFVYNRLGKRRQAAHDGICPRNGLNLLLFGIFQTGLQYALFYLSMNWLSGGRASLINTTNAFLSVLLARFFMPDDKMNFKKALGCLIGFLGIFLICGDAGGAETFKGDLMMFGSAFTFSMGNIICKRLTRTIPALEVTAWQMLFGGLFLLATGLLLGGCHVHGTFQGWAVMIFFIFQSASTFAIWNSLLTEDSVASVGIFTSFIPVVGVLSSALLPNEPFPGREVFLSMLCVVIGVALVNGSQNR